MRILTTLAWLSVLLVPQGASAQDGLSPERLDARAELVTGLQEYAAWSGRERLYAERARAWNLILELEPDDGEAHRGLGHKKSSKGKWIVPRNLSTPKNYDGDALFEAPTQYAAFVAPYSERMIALLSDPDATNEQREELEKELVHFDPENAAAHEMRGEVRRGDGWALRETVVSMRMREEIAGLVLQGLADPRVVEPLELTEHEKRFGLDLSVIGTDALRVLALREREALELESAVHAAQVLFESVFDVETSLPRGCSIYLLEGKKSKQAFLEKHPALPPELRKSFARLDGAGIPGTADWAHWSATPAKRRDAMVHMAVVWFLMDAFGVGIEHGWAFEGFGLYLTMAVTGTRLTWFVSGRGGDDLEVRDRLLDPATNWMKEAKDLLSASGPPQLAAALGKSAGELSVEDLLLSYAFAAYLVEGRPDDVPVLLELIGQGREPTEAAIEALGRDLETTQRRLLTWIEESRATEIEAPIDTARLVAVWTELKDKEKERVVSGFLQRIAELETGQLERVRELVAAEGDAPDQWSEAREAPHYDPQEHAPSQPIRRRLLEADHPAVKSQLKLFRLQPSRRALIESYRYDWATGEIVRCGDPNDPETLFGNALNGYPPHLDLARAVVLRTLDRGEERTVLSAFLHAYTDREGRIYPGTTLYDAWRSDEIIEMPDVDVLGIIHDVLGEWDRWVAPISKSEHEPLYARVSELYRRAKNYREPRECLADTFLIGEPVDRWAFGDMLTNLQALWADRGGDLDALAAEFPGAGAWADFAIGWVQRCKKKPEVWNAGRQREVTLAREAKQVRRALVDAMEDAGVLER